jgi:hypothetical protein
MFGWAKALVGFLIAEFIFKNNFILLKVPEIFPSR